MWDISLEKEIQIFEGHSNIVTGLHHSPDGNNIVSSGLDDTVRIWNIESRKEIEAIDVLVPVCPLYSPDGQNILSGGSSVRMCNITTQAITKKFVGHSETVSFIRFSPDNQQLASCSYDKTIRIWDFESGKEIKRLSGHSDIIFELHYSSDGSALVSCSRDKTIRIWDVKSGKKCKKLKGIPIT
ncbi:WD-40 repeat-containing protein [Reticulomyxa filosa]|uniref:WD-40 repeat-containing protein n=1 Tax=Reticulomyxa filosa TaxID=46433 RepID=X6P453_RETFI|nr:WD-40 repeat-containing protein [Reticulomyxa filosa]|eukprot:ETO32883.1 WD-40 repeat-containing protein [Reticulomyxa filosa]